MGRLLKLLVVISVSVLIFQFATISGLEYRLSQDVVPLSYNITIRPYFLPEDGQQRFTFYGQTSIIIKARVGNIREFAVHSDYLEFSEMRFLSAIGDVVNFTIEYESDTDKLFFKLKDVLHESANYTLSFKYTGRISSGYDGLYHISYRDAEDTEKLMVASQLQRIDARKVFPCFDEPSFKAYFQLHISRPKGFKSFTNTALLSTTVDENDAGRYVDHFETTPYMSTYLVAIVVSEFQSRGENNVFIHARPEYYNKTEFSYNVTKDLLACYNQLFDMPYEELGNTILQKAALSKFIHNGMENWGLMIYKEEVLIYEDGNTDLSGQQYTKTIISHETSHNWFGNAITFEWWGYFWLNEGFARYYQYFATHTVYPQYELDKQFVVNQLHYILNIDAVKSTQPLSEPDVASPSEIARKFSSITYVKGASIIRMISNAMSEENFQTAIRKYINANLFRSVEPADLLTSLKLFWPLTPQVRVEDFFRGWTEQVGYPLLTVILAADNLSVRVHQKRFLENPQDGSDPKLRYTIPLTYTTSLQQNFNNTYPVAYFHEELNEILFNFPQSVQWVMFNIQQVGYYRVMYDSRLWQLLNNALYEDNWSGIHEINRAQYVDDLFAFGKAGLLDYNTVFKWLEYLRTETNYIPWEAASTGLTFIGTYLTVEEHIDFGTFILFVTKKVFNQLGVIGSPKDPVLDVFNRKQIINFNCKYGHKLCILEVQTMLREYLNNGTEIPVDLRATVYCNGMRDGSGDDFDKLFTKFNATKVAREKLRMRYGLGCGRSWRNIEKYFEVVLSDDVPVAEKEGAISPLYKENPENIWPVYQMVTSRVEEVAQALDSWSSTANLISSIVNLFTTSEQRDAFEEYLEWNRQIFGSSAGTLDNALKKLDVKLEWSANRLDPLRAYLRSSRDSAAKNFVNIVILALTVLLLLL